MLFVYLLMRVDGDERLVGGHVFLGLSKRLQFTWEIFLFFLKETKIAESDRCFGEMQILDGGCVPVWGL